MCHPRRRTESWANAPPASLPPSPRKAAGRSCAREACHVLILRDLWREIQAATVGTQV